MLNKDSIWLGILIGLTLPAIFLGLLQIVNLILVSIYSDNMAIKLETQLLVSMFSDLIPVRYYFVSLKFEKTGRGVLVVLFLMMILYFVLLRPL